MTKKVNFWTQVISTMNGLIQFGAISPKEDVTSSFEIKAMDGRHFFCMEEDGEREGWTTMNCPGAMVVHTGEDLVKPPAEGEEPSPGICEKESFVVVAENGDIQLKAANGRIRIEGNDIEFVATGNAPHGVFWAKANETIKLDSKNITIDGKQSIKLQSPLTNITGAMTQIFSGLIYGVTAATAAKVLPIPGKMKP
tara:strand:- start:127 stop:714 length:588 start_codon:yes stop_codon:yes gene_type:complete